MVLCLYSLALVLRLQRAARICQASKVKTLDVCHLEADDDVGRFNGEDSIAKRDFEELL